MPFIESPRIYDFDTLTKEHECCDHWRSFCDDCSKYPEYKDKKDTLPAIGKKNNRLVIDDCLDLNDLDYFVACTGYTRRIPRALKDAIQKEAEDENVDAYKTFWKLIKDNTLYCYDDLWGKGFYNNNTPLEDIIDIHECIKKNTEEYSGYVVSRNIQKAITEADDDDLLDLCIEFNSMFSNIYGKLNYCAGDPMTPYGMKIMITDSGKKILYYSCDTESG